MIIPAILEDNLEEIDRRIEIARRFSKTIHIDFIDGKFASNKSFLDPTPFQKYKNQLNLEAHLMVDEPINYLDKLASVGFNRFLGHVEKMSDQVEFVAKGEALGAIGLGLDLDTHISSIEVPFDDLDIILLMSVKAGESGQVFDESILEKIKKLRNNYLGDIEMDGGINEESLKLSKEAGANSFCATSFIFRDDPKHQFETLKSLL